MPNLAYHSRKAGRLPARLDSPKIHTRKTRAPVATPYAIWRRWQGVYHRHGLRMSSSPPHIRVRTAYFQPAASPDTVMSRIHSANGRTWLIHADFPASRPVVNSGPCACGSGGRLTVIPVEWCGLMTSRQKVPSGAVGSFYIKIKTRERAGVLIPGRVGAALQAA